MSDEERAATRDLAKAAEASWIPARVRDELRSYLAARVVRVLDGPDPWDEVVVCAARDLLSGRGTISGLISALVDARAAWERAGR